MIRRVVVLSVVVFVALSLIALVIDSVLAKNDLALCKKPDGSYACGAADVIVAVSGGDTTSRANKAIELYRDGWGKKILFSGASADPKSISNAEAMKRIAIKAGVPNEDIYLDEISRNTTENAKNSTDILTKLQARSAILVSSQYHVERVKLNFRLANSDISYRTAVAPDGIWNLWFLRPSGWFIAIKEIAGIAQLSGDVNR